MDSKYQESLYKEHRDLFMLIMRLGNKVALQNQLRHLCLKLGLYKNTKHFNDTITELEESGLIETYGDGDYRNSKTDLIIVINPVLSWVHKELKEKGIAINKSHVDTDKNISDRADKSMFRIQYVINFIENKEINSIDELFVLLEADSSILFTERRGLEYFTSFIKHYHKQLYLNNEECKDMMRELSNVNKKQKKSVPSRKGKGKAYKEEKDKDIYVDYKVEKETPDNLKDIYTPDVKDDTSNDKNLDEISNKKFNNNFNSFLERGCWLRLDSTKDIEKPNFKETEKKVYFTLYILDINRKLNHIKIAEKTSRAYLMLQDFLENGRYYRNNNICKSCKKNINNENYEYIQRKTAHYIPVNDYNDIATIKRAFFYCNPNDKNNDDYKNCTDNKIRLRRKIYLNVVVLTWNEKLKNTLLTDCNYIKGKSYFNDVEKKLTEFQKECKDEGLSDDDIKKIRLKVYDYNLERNYLGGKSVENITKKNDRASLKKTIKEDIKNAQSNENSMIILDDESIEKLAESMVEKILK